MYEILMAPVECHSVESVILFGWVSPAKVLPSEFSTYYYQKYYFNIVPTIGIHALNGCRLPKCCPYNNKFAINSPVYWYWVTIK